MHQIRIENLIVIDIETAPLAANFTALTDEWQQLWADKVKYSLPEDLTAAQFYPKRAGVMAEFARVVCISMGYFLKEPHLKMRIKSFYGFNEKELLEQFLQTMNRIEKNNHQWCFAGHNIKEFDIPFLCRRLLINALPIPPYLDFQNMKPWETNMVDSFQYWRFGDYKHFTSLKLLAAVLGVPSPKDDIDGSMVGDLFWNGSPAEREQNLQRIARYCQKDVVATANIFLRFKSLALLMDEDIEFMS